MILLTELTANNASAQFIASFGSPEYARLSEDMMLTRRRDDLQERIPGILHEADDIFVLSPVRLGQSAGILQALQKFLLSLGNGLQPYYELYQRYKNDYNITEILSGHFGGAVSKAGKAAFYERLSLLGMLLDAFKKP